MKLLNSTHSITALIGSEVHTMRDDHPNFAEFSRACESGDEDLVKAIATRGKKGVQEVKITKAVQSDGGSDFSFDNGKVLWHGKELHGSLINKILSLVTKGHRSLGGYKNFLGRLFGDSKRGFEGNPSNATANGFFDFLDVKELPVDEEGFFYGYKGLNDEGWSIHGNKETIVLKGKVNENGQIYNGVGEEIEVPRNQVCEDRKIHCSHGLHVGSYEYAKGFGSLLALVRVDPKDVVCVPDDCGCKKARVCKYTVVSWLGQSRETEEIPHSTIKVDKNETGEPEVVGTDPNPSGGEPTPVSLDAVKARVEAYLLKKGAATIKQIQSSLSGYANLSSVEIERLASSAGWNISYDGSKLSASVVSL